MKFTRPFKKSIAAVVAVAMSLLSMPILPAQAGLVGTDQVLRQVEGSARDRVNAFLAREDVRAQMEALGVSPDEAQARVDALNDTEVEQIAGRLDTLPAGEGAIGAVIGAAVLIFVILLVTDLLGWTSVFSFTKKGAANPN